MKEDPLDKDMQAAFKMFERRSKVFIEEAVMNMLDSAGPEETIQVLTFWINEIIEMCPNIDTDKH